MKVVYQPSWLTWVASCTTCLQALGVDCDQADVAGYSGYAFHLAVSQELCPSGPTMVDWERLAAAGRWLGRSTTAFISSDCHTPEHANDATRAHCRAAFELAKSEIEAGRPCVIWGAYVPEFAVCVGIDGESYLVESYKSHTGDPQPPIPYDELNAPGGPYTLAFPTPRLERPKQNDPLPAIAAKCAINNAISFANGTILGVPHRYGVPGIELWIESLKQHQALKFGNAYNAACYAQARRYAHSFIRRLAEKHPVASAPLNQAAEAYDRCASALGRVSELFPFKGAEEGMVDDDVKIKEAVGSLELAKAAEAQAVQSLAKAIDSPW